MSLLDRLIVLRMPGASASSSAETCPPRASSASDSAWRFIVAASRMISRSLLLRLQVLRGDEDGRRLAVHGDGHPLVVVVDAADELGQVGLDVAQRKHGHGQKYDQKSR